MKVAICVPVYSDPKAEFLASLANMVAAEAGTMAIKTFVVRGLLPMNRNLLAKKALDWRADHVLWADADMSFPPDALSRLMAHNVEIVGVNYPRRDNGQPTTVCGAKGGLEAVENMGLGLCLVNAQTLQKLQERASSQRLPLFHFELQADGAYLGEDHFFFRRARELQIPVHLDHDLSKSIAHVAERLLTNGECNNVDLVRAPSGFG